MPKFKVTLYREKIVTFDEAAEFEIEAKSVEDVREQMEVKMSDWNFRRKHNWENLGTSDQDIQNYEVGEIEQSKE